MAEVIGKKRSRMDDDDEKTTISDGNSSNAQVMEKGESVSSKAKNNVEDKVVKEEVVSFKFGNEHYGTKLFNDTKDEAAKDLKNSFRFHPSNYPTEKGFKYSDDEIYKLSSTEDVLDSFFKDNLL